MDIKMKEHTSGHKQEGLQKKKRLEVDVNFNPTRLFNLLKRYQWSGADQFLKSEPVEASIWICNKSDGRNIAILPIHLVAKNWKKGKSDLVGRQASALINTLISVYPEGVKHADHAGNYPLHLALRSAAPIDAVTSILLAYPDALLKEDCDGKTPMEVLKLSYDSKLISELLTRVANSYNDLREEKAAVQEENLLLKENLDETSGQVSSLKMECTNLSQSRDKMEKKLQIEMKKNKDTIAEHVGGGQHSDPTDRVLGARDEDFTGDNTEILFSDTAEYKKIKQENDDLQDRITQLNIEFTLKSEELKKQHDDREMEISSKYHETIAEMMEKFDKEKQWFATAEETLVNSRDDAIRDCQKSNEVNKNLQEEIKQMLEKQAEMEGKNTTLSSELVALKNDFASLEDEKNKTNLSNCALEKQLHDLQNVEAENKLINENFDTAVTEVQRLKQEKKELKTKNKKEASLASEHLKNAMARIVTLSSKTTELEKELGKVKQQFSAATSEVDSHRHLLTKTEGELEKLKEEKVTLTDDKLNLQAQVNALESQVSDVKQQHTAAISEVETLSASLEKTEKELQEFKKTSADREATLVDDKLTLQSQVKDLESELSDVKQQHSVTTSKVGTFRDLLTKTEGELEKLKEEKDALRNDKMNLQAEMQTFMNAAESVKQEYSATIADAEMHRDLLAKTKDEFQDSKEKSADREASLVDDKLTLQAQVKDLEIHRDLLAKTKDEFQDFKEKSADREASLVDDKLTLQAQVKVLESKVSDDAAEIKAHYDLLAKTKAELQTLQNLQGEWQATPDLDLVKKKQAIMHLEWQEMKNEVDVVKGEKHKLRNELAVLKEKNGAYTNEIANLQSKVSENEKYKESLAVVYADWVAMSTKVQDLTNEITRLEVVITKQKELMRLQGLASEQMMPKDKDVVEVIYSEDVSSPDVRDESY